MTYMAKRNTSIKWLIYLTDVLTYVVVIELLALCLPFSIPSSIVNNTGIADILGGVCFAMFTVLHPPLIHLRRIKVEDILKRNIIVAVCSQALFAVVWHSITINSNNEEFYFFVSTLSVILVLLVVRILERFILGELRKRGRNSRTVVFVGSDPANLAVYNEMKYDPTTGYRVLGYYSNNEIADAPEDFRKLGSKQKFEEVIAGNNSELHVDEIYCSLSHSEDELLRKVIHYCDREVIHFFYVPRIFPNLQMSLKPEIVGRNVVFTNHHEPLMEVGTRMIKRAFDIVVSLLLLIVLLPFLPVIAYIVKKQSPGPLFFRQERTGMNGENFMCYKFRSMHINDDADRVQATKDDPRKFPFGNFMRKYNIDELPQFYNVLKGDMSIVGPRPHMTLHTEQYSALIEKYMVRHFAKPGITGLAQITGFRGETEELWQMEGRIRKDIDYIENWTFWLDVKICFLTAWSMVHHDKNAY